MNRSTNIRNRSSQQGSGAGAEPDFHGAAIIDEQGREIPITEAMVQRACARLEQAWAFPVTIQSPEK